MKCPYCGYVNNNGPPVRIICISCFVPLVPPSELSPRGEFAFGRTALDKRARFTRDCYDPMAQYRIAEKYREKKAAELKDAG